MEDYWLHSMMFRSSGITAKASWPRMGCTSKQGCMPMRGSQPAKEWKDNFDKTYATCLRRKRKKLR